MTLRNRLAHLGGIALVSVEMVGQAAANHSCRNTGTFEQWLAGFKQEALASGISQSTISRALDGATYDPNIIRRDHGQGVFQQSFLQFSDRMVGGGRGHVRVRRVGDGQRQGALRPRRTDDADHVR